LRSKAQVLLKLYDERKDTERANKVLCGKSKCKQRIQMMFNKKVARGAAKHGEAHTSFLMQILQSNAATSQVTMSPDCTMLLLFLLTRYKSWSISFVASKIQAREASPFHAQRKQTLTKYKSLFWLPLLNQFCYTQRKDDRKDGRAYERPNAKHTALPAFSPHE
jgi:hypothetical protein